LWIDQPALQRLLGVEDAAGHHPFERLLRTHQARQEPARAGLHDDGAAREDEAVARRLRREPHVHRQLHGDADADRRAVAGRDSGLQRVVKTQGEQTAAVAMAVEAGIGPAILRVEGVGAARQISTGTEAAARAGEHDRPHVVIAVGLVHRVEQFLQHRAGEGVQFVGTVQRDREDSVLRLVLDLLVGHGRFLTSG
jgi:hypothetical protein